MSSLWAGFKDWMLAVGNPREWERQKAYRQAATNAEAGILTPTIQKQLDQWSNALGGNRTNQGVKVVFDSINEWTDVYFGGVEKPDGDGHGHIRADIYGNTTIIREPYLKGEPNARRDATILDDTTPDKRLTD